MCERLLARDSAQSFRLAHRDRETGKLYFVAKKDSPKSPANSTSRTTRFRIECKFLSENLIFYSLAKKERFLFFFDRSQRALVEKIADSVRQRLQSSASSAPVPA